MSGPEAISSVKICAFQWPFDAAVVCLTHVLCSAIPGGEAGGWTGVLSCFPVTSLNYLLTEWHEFVFVQTEHRYIFQSRCCVCPRKQEVFFPAHCISFFPPLNTLFFSSESSNFTAMNVFLKDSLIVRK